MFHQEFFQLARWFNCFSDSATWAQAVSHPFIVTLHYAFQTPKKLWPQIQWILGQIWMTKNGGNFCQPSSQATKAVLCPGILWQPWGCLLFPESSTWILFADGWRLKSFRVEFFFSILLTERAPKIGNHHIFHGFWYTNKTSIDIRMISTEAQAESCFFISAAPDAFRRADAGGTHGKAGCEQWERSRFIGDFYCCCGVDACSIKNGRLNKIWMFWEWRKMPSLPVADFLK